MIELGRLKEVNIRNVWKHEQYGFSAWLAQEENIKQLSETLGLDLTVISTEYSVGKYRCDIWAKDEMTQKNVVIENQLEASNHEHLGKIITYASGLDASIIVWIVGKADEEHASAIKWLNDHTDEDIHFFLIELHAYQIGDSKPAPQFRIVQQPNNFSKITKAIAKNTLNDAKILEFWTMFNEIVDKRGKPFNIRKASTGASYNVVVGTSKCVVSTDLINKENKIRVGIYIPSDKSLFNTLSSHKEEIEKNLNLQLEWANNDNVKSSSINTYIYGLDFNDQSNYEELINQTIDTILKFRKVFKQYI